MPRKYPVVEKLPRKYSELLEVALRDFEEIEKNPKYAINMGVFHTLQSYDPREVKPEDVVCEVCFAGAVMAGTLGADRVKALIPMDFRGLDLQLQLYDLDHMRKGDWDGLNRRLPRALRNDLYKAVPEVPDYFVHRDRFFSALRTAMRVFRSYGF